MDNKLQIKKEILDRPQPSADPKFPEPYFIEIDEDTTDVSDTSSSSSDDSDCGGGKRRKVGVVLPDGFLDPLPSEDGAELARGGDEGAEQARGVDDEVVRVAREVAREAVEGEEAVYNRDSRKFWKADDFEARTDRDWESSSGGFDHVRIHPRFLHSNATSHKWVLGAFAELLDNALDEVSNGATYVNIDMCKSKKDGNRMLLIEDNGGGMDPDKLRQCMSLGYSLKSQVADTIGQYGNGFKTSTMRLGADVIVFSRCSSKDGKRLTQSIGLLSYTFLVSTGKEDIVVPMLDYERVGQEWKKIIRSSDGDWNRNVDTMVRWSPFASEADLLRQFDHIKDHGTRIIIYNLWEDDQGLEELDFDTDQYDIQIRGVNRDEKNIQMAEQFPNSWHFLTYRHSLRSYASILYLRIPRGFRIILRGRDIEHHKLVNDMMITNEVTYRPQPGPDGVPKDCNMVAIVTMGFVKDAKSHIDVQGFNVYHKNRLIKPFWRVWNPPGSAGRGVIGVLEANFVEPAHDKQGFERTIVLSRLEARLIQMQRKYWSTYCHRIGYARAPSRKIVDDRDSSPEDFLERLPSKSKKQTVSTSSKIPVSDLNKSSSNNNPNTERRLSKRVHSSCYLDNEEENVRHASIDGNQVTRPEGSSAFAENLSNSGSRTALVGKRTNGSLEKSTLVEKTLSKDNSSCGRDSPIVTRSQKSFLVEKTLSKDYSASGRDSPIITRSQAKGVTNASRDENVLLNNERLAMEQLIEENRELKERVQKREDEILGDLMRDLESERDQCTSLESQLQVETKKIEELNKDYEALVGIISEEKERRDTEVETLREKLKEASNTIQELVEKLKLLERRR